jgi:hypothetical protein
MSAFYDRMSATALSLIAKFGRELTMSRKISGSYNPETGLVDDDISEAQTIRAVVLPASKGTVEAFDSKFEAGTLIESNIRALKIAADGLLWPPSPGNSITIDGEVWTMIGSTESSPGGTPMVYSASIKR